MSMVYLSVLFLVQTVPFSDKMLYHDENILSYPMKCGSVYNVTKLHSDILDERLCMILLYIKHACG
jgi:hypothetical protein